MARRPVPQVGRQLDALGPAMRRLRQRRGMTQAELSERCGIDVSWISQIENGRRRNPGWETIVRMTHALDESPLALARIADALAREAET